MAEKMAIIQHLIPKKDIVNSERREEEKTCLQFRTTCSKLTPQEQTSYIFIYRIGNEVKFYIFAFFSFAIEILFNIMGSFQRPPDFGVPDFR